MSLLGQGPEKRRYNIFTLLFALTFVLLLGGLLLRSILLEVLSFVYLIFILPWFIKSRLRYYSFLYRKFHGPSRKKEKQTDGVLVYFVVGLVILIFGLILYIFHQDERIYRILFRNQMILSIVVLIYGVYRVITQRRNEQ